MNQTIIPKPFSHELLRRVSTPTVGSPDAQACASSSVGRQRPGTARIVNFSGWMSVIIVLSLPCAPALAVDPLPAARKLGGVGWNARVGIPSPGIPTRPTFQTIPAGATLSTVQNAINACLGNQAVQLSAGTYNWSGRLIIRKNNVTLRGAGMGMFGQQLTTINTTSPITIGDQNTWWNQFENPVAGNVRAWTAGYAQGTTTITVSSTSGMSVGNLIFLDQLNDSDTTAYSPVNPSGPYLTGEYTSVANPLKGYERIQFQINRIQAINGNQITLYEPLYMPNWSAGRTPQVWFETAPTVYSGSGVEDLRLNISGAGTDGITMEYTYGCWVKNCYITGVQAHMGYVAPTMCVRPEIRHCYLRGPNGSDNYGIRTRMVSGALIEDNIADKAGQIVMINGIHGSVIAYNFFVPEEGQFGPYGYMDAGLLTHGGTPNMVLMEGNYLPQIQLDTQWQNSSYMVAARNRLTGVPATLTQSNVSAANIMEMHHHASFIGNVLGTTGYNTVYEDTNGTCHDPQTSGAGHRVFYIGNRSGGTGCGGANYDPLSLSTLLRAVNWDSATNGIVGGGFTTSDLPNSYYLASKPTFFGNLAWPAFNPSSPSLGPVAIPAGYRFVNGTEPPPGGTPAPTPTPTPGGTPTPTPTATPGGTPTPTPAATPPLGTSFDSTQGVITSPFVVNTSTNTISQPIVTTDPTQGGRAIYTFNVTIPGDYLLSAMVNCPDGGSNSLFVNIDAEPTTAMIWDIPVTSGLEIRIASWSPGTTPKAWTLTAGTHQLIIRGREANTILGHINLGIAPNPPTGLQVIP